MYHNLERGIEDIILDCSSNIEDDDRLVHWFMTESLSNEGH